MPEDLLLCPNPKCAKHTWADSLDFNKKGFFASKSSGIHQRYQCKACKATFSARTRAEDRGQHKPQINAMLYGLLCSGVTLRRSAILLQYAYNTIRSRLPWLASRARALHAQALASGSLDTSYILFDERDNQG